MAAASMASSTCHAIARRAAVFAGLAGQLPRNAVWVTSNLRRTQETAEAIIRAGLPGPETIPGPEALAIDDLAEQDFGKWQGRAYDELHQSRAGELYRFSHARGMKPPQRRSALSPLLSGYRERSAVWSRHMPGAISSSWRMAARSAPLWRWRSASTRKQRSPSRSRTARLPASIISTVLAWVTAGAL